MENKRVEQYLVCLYGRMTTQWTDDELENILVKTEQ